MYEWSDIRTFLAVMEHGSAAAAARALGISQTTISRRIERLEAALALRLFEPGARGAAPTANARALLPDAEAMAHAGRGLAIRAEEMRRSLSGLIRLTTTPGVSRHLSGILRAFRAAHPDIRFELDADDRLLSLEQGEADVAMRAAMRLTGDTLIARRMFDHPWGFYASEGYLQDHGKPASMAEISAHRLVLYSRSIEDRVECVARAQGAIPAANRPLRVSSVEAMTGLLLDGEGLGLLPRASGDIEDGLRMCVTERGMVQRFWLVWSPQGEATPHVRAFIGFVTDRLPDLLRGLPPEWVA